ncbi:MAG: hypothetical protein M3O33_14860, partial [Cyanobacteriota bacterium]|nr:hypothetical protein [Cyanobacteriota bacterium]
TSHQSSHLSLTLPLKAREKDKLLQAARGSLKAPPRIGEGFGEESQASLIDQPDLTHFGEKRSPFPSLTCHPDSN